MKRRYKVDYDTFVNCYEQIAHVKTDLIYGNTEYVKDPFISYVVPVYKRPDLLSETLDSILNQEPVDIAWDIVVVDNEPEAGNETEQLIRRLDNPRILYYRNSENVGVDGNYNKCIEAARGEWVAMIHGDDLITADHLKNSVRDIAEASANKRIKPAYICQRYIDFSDRELVHLNREKASGKHSRVLKEVYNDGKLKRLTQSYGVFTGFFGALPSFGTLMNRQIMLNEGGFNVDLGICEDVITPYKLADKYGVYMTSVIMGYHRFENSESMKIETIKKIYASMVDFREYMYSSSVVARIWAYFARDIMNKELRNYCIGLSRFSSRRITISELNEIYAPQEVGSIREFIFKIIIETYYRINGLMDYDGMIQFTLDYRRGEIEKAVMAGDGILLYGAGAATRSLIPKLRKNFPGINIIGCAVSGESDQRKIYGIPISRIDELELDKDKTSVITSTVIWEYTEEMNAKLEELGYEKVINFIDME